MDAGLMRSGRPARGSGASAAALARMASRAGAAAAEVLWPTRCALCERPGAVLCDACARALHWLDWWRACPRCGAPFGRVQCSECNDVALAHLGRSCLPFAGCVSAVHFDDDAGRVVRVFKDHDEQRLGTVMAQMVGRAIPPGWSFDAVTCVPASKAAYRRRGFDHAELLARAVALQAGVPFVGLLARPRARDQRALGRAQRVRNMAGRFSALGQCEAPGSVLLVDDVYTTGATLCDATDALLAAGVRTVRCVTFARVV